MKPTQAHYTTAQRIYDCLGRGSVADIDAIAQALVDEHERSIEIAAQRFLTFSDLSAEGNQPLELHHISGAARFIRTDPTRDQTER